MSYRKGGHTQNLDKVTYVCSPMLTATCGSRTMAIYHGENTYRALNSGRYEPETLNVNTI